MEIVPAAACRKRTVSFRYDVDHRGGTRAGADIEAGATQADAAGEPPNGRNDEQHPRVSRPVGRT